MKVKIVSSFAAVALAGVFLTALAFTKPETPASESISASPSPNPSPAVSEPAEGFWVCDYNGLVAVFHNEDHSIPIEMTDISLHTLRYEDQSMLSAGIFFEDYMDVVRFLEDFCP